MADCPDWHSQVLIKGLYGTTLTPLAVDVLGNLLALIQGDYGGVLKTVAVDANGLIKVNLTVQDLNYLKVRPNYGQAQSLLNTSKVLPNGADTTIFSVSGMGICLGAVVYASNTVLDQVELQPEIEVDGVSITCYGMSEPYTYGPLAPQGYPFVCGAYDPIKYTYCVHIRPGFTFESTLKLKCYNNIGAEAAVRANLFYALVP